MKMDFTFFYRTFVILCFDITISAPLKTEDCTPKKKARTQNEDQNTALSLRRICLQEMGEQPNVSIPKLGAFKLGELLKCMDTKYEEAKLTKAKLTPRMLIDDIEGDFASEYQMAASQFNEKFARLNENVKKTKGKIQNLRNILAGRPMSAEERQNRTEELKTMEEYLKNISQEEKDYAYYRSPLPDDAREERMERRIRKWHWKYYYGISDRNIDKLRARVKTEYDKYRDSKDFETYPRTLAEFTMDLFLALAEGHDTGSGVVHIDGKISAEEEFPLIPFLGDDYLDLHLTMFINTLGRKKPFDPKMFDKRNRLRTSTIPTGSTSTT